MRLHLRVLGALAIVASAAACDESLSTLPSPTPSLEPTFSSIQREIFEPTTPMAGPPASRAIPTSAKFLAAASSLLASVSYGNLVNERAPTAVRAPRRAEQPRCQLPDAQDRRNAWHQRAPDAAQRAVPDQRADPDHPHAGSNRARRTTDGHN